MLWRSRIFPEDLMNAARRPFWLPVPLLMFAWLAGLAACTDEPVEAPPDAVDLAAAETADMAPAPPDLAPLPDILVVLRGLPGVKSVEERGTTLAGYRSFRILFDQPADHRRPEGQRFQQRVTLLHRSYDAPMVLYLSGYGSATWSNATRAELTALLSANQLEVEHRFFPPSRPEPPDFAHLTIEQSAADHHRLVQALRPYYGARWASTGSSKGGMTAVYHRRFHPADVDACVPYVAPNSLGAPDGRYVPFVASAGDDPGCRARLAAFQRQALTRRTEMQMRMTATGAMYTRLGLDKALEHAVLELPFGFWQYQSPSRCASIPADGAAAADVYKFLNDVGQVGLYADGGVNYFGPYYYQAARQLGYPAVDEGPVKDLLRHPGTDRPESYLPQGVSATYEPGAMRDIASWLKAEGRAFLFLYGEYDPWTAASFEPVPGMDAHRYVVPRGNHGAKLRDLPAAQRDEALSILGRWMGVKPQAMLSGLLPGEALLEPEAPVGRPRL